MIDEKQAKALQKAAMIETQSTRRFMDFLLKTEKTPSSQQVAAFDSMLASYHGGRAQGVADLPVSMQRIITHEDMQGGALQSMFDGLYDGIAEYRKRNGGDNPHAMAVASALCDASLQLGGAENQENSKCTFDHSTAKHETQYDSLTLGHHESLSVVPASVQVVIAYGISNALPLVTMLPNPTGSNELPIVFGSAVAGSNMGVVRRGDLMDGGNAGMPYLENRHTLTMEMGATGAYSLTSYVAYTPALRADGTTKFVVDKAFMKAPFLGGRVVIRVKGVEVANDKNRNHPTIGSISTLQPLPKVKIGVDTFVVTSATANLDTYEINVQFDLTNGVQPAADDVTVELIFDYERKDPATGIQILREPSTDMVFSFSSIFAHPSRSRSTATIDAVTQLANELGINWYAAVQAITMQRYYFEQTGRLLRTAVNMCLSNQDPVKGRVVTFDFTTNGVSPINIASAFSKINITLGMARTRLSKAINIAIGGYDLYVSDRGAAFFSGLDGTNYEPTTQVYGDQYSVYRIGTLKNSGANVYYVPDSMGVFNETALASTASALMVPRTSIPAQAPFVGMVAVPPMILSSNGNAFEQDIAMYSRMAADVNPIDRFSNQFILIQLTNLPNL